MNVNQSSLNIIEGYGAARDEIDAQQNDGADIKASAANLSSLIERYHPNRLNLRVSDILIETPTTKTLRLRHENEALPPFQAGQYVNLLVEIDGVKTSRPYAIASSPSVRDYYDVTIKRVPNGYVSSFLLDRVQIGDRVASTGPMGTFHYNPLFHGEDLVFLAGGSGITPAMSMIRHMQATDPSFRIHVLYGSLSEQDIIFRQEIDELAERMDNLNVTHVISNPSGSYKGEEGFLDRALIARLIRLESTTMFYLCGPPAMYEFCLQELAALNVPSRRIRCEVNGPPIRPENEPGWPDYVDRENTVSVKIIGEKSFQALSSEPLLNSMERNGVNVPAACRSGECSLCRVKIEEGEVLQAAQARTRKSDTLDRFVHACVCYPMSDTQVTIL